MRTAVGRVVDAQDDLARQFALDSNIPHVKIGVACRRSTQIVVVAISPLGKLTILPPLRRSKSGWERIFERGILRLEIIIRENDGRRLAERGSRILKVRGRTHAEINSGAAAHDRLLIERVGKTEPRADIISIDRHVPHVRAGKLRCADQLLRGWKTDADTSQRRLGAACARRGSAQHICQIDADTRGRGEIAELNAVVALVVRRAPFVANAEVQCELGGYLPVVLEIETGFGRPVGDRG